MNEKKLKHLFCNAFISGHIKNNTVLPNPADHTELKISEEACFRGFDLVIIAIAKGGLPRKILDGKPVTAVSFESSLGARSQLFRRTALKEKCRADCIRFLPVEVKSDSDNLDSRLARQIVMAITTFGESIVVLDERHSQYARLHGIHKLLPATVIGYSGHGDYFEVLSSFGHRQIDTIFSFDKRMVAKALLYNDLDISPQKVYSRIVLLQRIFEKLAFNQIYGPIRLSTKEAQFVREIVTVNMHRTDRADDLIKETENTKITDYL